ncbi:MAG: ATP-dependent RecD-like DNA helicase [Lachnospiraceae bacterium]|nr:ATP-dependent RecD-like DNA helicase [Lachnospiraceae bacterium]
MESIQGYVEHIIFQNADNGYTVMNLVADGEEITCVGMLKGISQGESIKAEGDYISHPVYGNQFKISSFQTTLPEDSVSMERYLGSGAIRGVGPALAARIVKKFGADTFRIIDEEPERLVEIKGISERIAREISAQMEEKKDLREAMVYLQKFGISNTLAIKIYNTYGNGLYHVMQENPYRLAEDIQGVGFKIADEIAGKIGIHTDSDYRIRSGLLYTLLQAVQEGNTYLPMEILRKRAAALLELKEEYMDAQVANLSMDRKIVIKGAENLYAGVSGQISDEAKVFASTFYFAELNCARMLHDLNLTMAGSDGLLPSEEKYILERVKRLDRDLGLELDELQMNAVLESVKHGLLIISGGPGTGKTTTINTIIRYFESENMDIFLAAPTGRAAKRMTEATGYEARTIHRMLELNGALSDDEHRSVRFERNEENPLEADVIIVDEMSMVDLTVFQALLKAVTPGTRLILVGDVDQLPSVGPGQILRDLIESGAFPTVTLKKIFRQAGESDIVVNAHKINRGEQIALDNKSRDFFFLERSDTNVIYKHMVQLITEKLPKYVDADSLDIQVLTPMRKGTLGVETLNKILQEYINPPAVGKKEHVAGDTVLRMGDKVMQIRNNYQLEWEVLSRYGIPIDKGMGVFNGDVGKIVEINDYAQQLVVEFEEQKRVTYAYAGLEELELAYAVTIHKSQGSEYPAVVLPILSGPKMLLNRNLLYTAVTRAKTCVTILGSSETVRDMIENAQVSRRYTALRDRICEIRGN